MRSVTQSVQNREMSPMNVVMIGTERGDLLVTAHSPETEKRIATGVAGIIEVGKTEKERKEMVRRGIGKETKSGILVVIETGENVTARVTGTGRRIKSGPVEAGAIQKGIEVIGMKEKGAGRWSIKKETRRRI